MAKDEIAKSKKGTLTPQYENMISGYQNALQVVDDVILKRYVSDLSELEVVPLDKNILRDNISENVSFFKINEMVYEKEEFAAHKFASVFNSLSATKSAIFVMIDSDGVKTDFYMGVRSFDDDRETGSLKNTLKNAMSGQFPGIKTTDCMVEDISNILSKVKTDSISSVSCVANNREEKSNKNEEFVQGLEKLVLSMSGQKYTGIIIANTTSQSQLRMLRKQYEDIYTQLSPFATVQMNYGQNSTIGRNETISNSTNKSTTNTVSQSDTTGTGKSHTVSKENTTSKMIRGVSAASSMIGAALAPATGGVSLAIGGVVGGGLGMLGSMVSETGSDSDSVNSSYTYSKSKGETVGTSDTYSHGKNTTESTSNAITLTAHDKKIEDMLARIDKQLERMNEFESLGMYECAAYFLSSDQCTSEMAAATYKAIMGGEDTGVEVTAINSWGMNKSDKTELVGQYVKNFMHPVFKYQGILGNLEVTPSAMVSGNELSIHMGLPRKSVCGLPVIEHADFGKEVINYDGDVAHNGINLGKIFNMGREASNRVFLDKNSLAMHTFITGSTGSGKSNVIYELIRQCNNLGARFLVIEPAKGEYKHVFGNRSDVRVFGSNPEYSDLFRINPFKFSKGIHVLEHVDRLVEIFNVCWPMYAAMPAVLKEALLKSYEDCGWDLSLSRNIYDDDLYPTFLDLQEELIDVINRSAYSEEVKSNYIGSLVTRVKSLTNGLNGQMFTANEVGSQILFEENVIVDLSRIGSLETKSLIMGLLIMRLSEHRMSTSQSMNIPFRHMTILEEAHNILKKTSTEQNPENPSVAGKSVEMIANAIAEMRTYGEGFIIADQSPSAVDISAIRNTNTKIIMRLPDEVDRRLAGKSAGLKDEQLDEIAKLPKGVGVVYQNDWIDPVLCKIQKYKGTESKYCYNAMIHLNTATVRMKKNLLELLLKTRVKDPIEVNIDILKEDLKNAEISSKNKLLIKGIISEYEQRKELSLWEEDKFKRLSGIVSQVLNAHTWMKNLIDTSSEFDILTDRVANEIITQTKDFSSEYAIAAAQCLIRSEAEKSEDYKEIYAAWITNLRNKGVF